MVLNTRNSKGFQNCEPKTVEETKYIWKIYFDHTNDHICIFLINHNIAAGDNSHSLSFSYNLFSSNATVQVTFMLWLSVYLLVKLFSTMTVIIDKIRMPIKWSCRKEGIPLKITLYPTINKILKVWVRGM